MNKILPLIVLLLWSYSCTSQKPASNNIKNAVAEFIADTSFTAAGMSIVIADVESGGILAQHNSSLALIPASSQKLITTATALEILGSDYQFKTLIETDGKIENGILKGNLILKGFGDPTLESKYFENQQKIAAKIVQKLKELKINTIQGNIIADKSYFDASIPRTWIWEDIGNYYGAVPNAINYRDNMYLLYFESGKAGSKTKIVTTKPLNTGLEFDNQVMSSEINRDLAYIFGGNISNKRKIEGSIPQNRKKFEVKGAFLNPDLALIEDLEHELRKARVQVLKKKNQYSDKRQELFMLSSPKLDEIIYWTNQKSVNLFADQLLFEIGKQKNNLADWSSGVEAITDYWTSKGIQTKYQRLYDGSGLSHFNAVSADFFNEILYSMYHSDHAEVFLSSLPIAGKSGTLKYFGKGKVIESNWIAKTGSMTGVKTYCGYLKNSKGETYTVCILINNYHCTSKELNIKLLNFLINIFNS